MVEEIKKLPTEARRPAKIEALRKLCKKLPLKENQVQNKLRRRRLFQNPKKVKIRSDKKIKATEDNIQKKDDAGNLDDEVKKSPKLSYDKKRLVDLAEIHPTTKYIYQLKKSGL